MNLLLISLLFLAVTGAAIFVVVRIYSRRIERDILQRIEESFGKASLQALAQNSEQFLRLAGERLAQASQSNIKELESKKELIDNTLQHIRTELEKMQGQITAFERDRNEKFGALNRGLQNQSEQTAKLQEITTGLSKILSGSKVRGQWGERMAEDLLKVAGLVEGINYRKQRDFAQTGRRPDYTFLLPENRFLNMDVKFPLDNYIKYCEETNESLRQSYRKQFLADATKMIKDVTGRDYINPESGTLDYVLVFIPNEQVYAFLLENDVSFVDNALKSKVIVCSPVTLYAVLAIIRQSLDNFNLERSAHKILELMSAFYKQWGQFIVGMDKLGKRIEELQNEFNTIVTTRRNQLEKPLQQIESLARQQALSEPNSNGRSVIEGGAGLSALPSSQKELRGE